MAGLAVRLWCARGPLWLDEIWSIENLAPLTRLWQVFWGISHDNNHFLNSLWLYFATGFSADERYLRAPSIAMGALTIAMMARIAARHSPAAALAAGAMAAVSYFLVNYSVEARGYSGMALAILVAFDAMERATARPRSRARSRLRRGGGDRPAVAFGDAAGHRAVRTDPSLRGRAQDRRLGAGRRVDAPLPGADFVAVLPALAFVVARRRLSSGA